MLVTIECPSFDPARHLVFVGPKLIHTHLSGNIYVADMDAGRFRLMLPDSATQDDIHWTILDRDAPGSHA